MKSMAGPRDEFEPEVRGTDRDDRSVRPPAKQAWPFYPHEAEACRAEAASYLRAATSAGERSWLGALVPHAGWICSGAIAGEAIATLAKRSAGEAVDVVVVFGAVHTALPARYAALDSHPRWWMPFGEARQATEVGRRLGERRESFVVDDRFHVREHAVEVELPLVQLAFPDAAVLPIEVPLIEPAARIGRETAQTISAAGLKAVFLASSDLTHYGPGYGFAPAGVGLAGLEWAKDNDRRVLDLILAVKAEAVVPEVMQRMNACGGGAIAAMVAACGELGATESRLLRHANSYETLMGVVEQRPEDAVGYAGMVIG